MTKKKQNKPETVQVRVLGAPAFAAISAIEGLGLSAVAKQRVDDLNRSDLTPAERRAAILRAYAQSAKRK